MVHPMKKHNNFRAGKIYAIAVLAVACTLLLALFALPTSAEESMQTNIENVLTYDGLSARTKGCGGIRSVYLVDRDAVTALEAAGYSVAYGAVMGIGTYQGKTVNTTRSLAVNGDFTNGFTVANDNAAAIVVYATGSPDYVKGIHLDDTNSSFAYTTTYAVADAAKYGVGLVYTGFVSVTDAQGNQTVLYDYAEGRLFGGDESSYGTSTSLSELADWFVNGYDKSAVKAYHYNNNATLRNVLEVCGEEIRVLAAPIVLTEIDGEVSLAKTLPASYVTAAREAYKTPAYADYTTSIISNYSTTAAANNDRPTPVTLSWTNDGGEELTYTLTLATDALFTQNVRVVTSDTTSADIYNLYTNTTYYFKVEAVTADGYSYETAASTFKTADTVRWIYVGGVRNVRDMGGWNGLNQGLIYRGSELNLVGTHGLQISDAGIKTMKGDLGIKTDLDFRASSENGTYGTASPLGEGVTWVNRPIGNFMSAFNTSYKSTMRLFLDYDNYPIYMHCWGGADRTGTVAFMLSGLCGASEEDLAIDLEQTSFSIFGYRYRYDNGAYLYASTIARVKTYNGNTLQEKFETCFKEVYGFTEAEISQIQAINTQSGAVYDFAENEHGDVLYNSNTDESFSFTFVMRNSTTVTSVVVDGIALDFDFDTASSTVTVYGDKLIENDVLGGMGVITFDDGASLRFYIETDLATALAERILAGDYALLFDGSDAVTANGTVTVSSDGSFKISAALAAALYNAGYESVDVKLPAGITVTAYTTADTVLSTETTSVETTLRLPLNGGKVTFTTESGTLTLDGFAFNKVGSYWVDEISGGDYKAFFGTGTNGISEAGDPILDVTSSNFTVSADTIKKLTAFGYTHLTFTVDITFADGTTGCYLAIRHSGKRYEQLYPAITSVDGRVMATVTIALNDTTNLQLITRTCTVTDGKAVTTSYTAASADSFIISGVSFAKSGTEGAVDNHPVPDPNEEYVKAVNGGAYDTLFPSGTLTADTDGDPIQVIPSGNFIVTQANLAKAIAAGYSFINFTVKVEMPEGVTEGFICVRMNGTKYETLYPAFTTLDGVIYATATLPIGADTTTLQFISRADYTADGKVNTGSHDQVSATFTFSDVSFSKTGTVGVTVVEEVEPSNVDRIMDGDYALLFSTDVTVENGEVTAPSLVHFRHDILVELYEAGYTTISFHVVSELTGTASATDTRVRVVARWSSGGSNYISNSDKQDIDLGGKLGTAEKTLTFHLTEQFLGETNFIRLHAQTGSSILFTDFVFGK